MSTSDRRPTPDRPVYEIGIAGRFGAGWSAWFDDLIVIPRDDGTTVLRGPIVDQAALHGVLRRLRDLGVPLLWLTAYPSPTNPEPPVRPHEEP